MITDYLFYQSEYARILKVVKNTAADTNAKVYIVGGAVRDLFLSDGVSFSDMDFVVFNCPYDLFARKLAKAVKSCFVQFKDNVRIPIGESYIDVSAPRGDSLKDDLMKRDFTINNLAVDMDGNIIGDNSDILSGIIRPVYQDSLKDDPLRILRGFRQAAKYNFRLSDDFLLLTAGSSKDLLNVAPERINEELKKMSLYYNIFIHDKMLEFGIYKVIFGFSPVRDIYIFKSDDEDNLYSMFLAYLLRNNVNLCKNVLHKLKVSNKIYSTVNFLLDIFCRLNCVMKEKKKHIWRHMSLIKLALYFSSALGEVTSDNLSDYNKLMSRVNVRMAKSVTGNDIISMAGDKPKGKWISELLEDVQIKLAFGDICGKDEALEYIRRNL